MNTLPPSFKLMNGMVTALLTAARKNNLMPGDDLPYMPETATTLVEAVGILRSTGRLLIQGGELRWRGVLTAHMFGRKDTVTLNWAEAKKLLTANYTMPNRPYRRVPYDFDTARLQLQRSGTPTMGGAFTTIQCEVPREARITFNRAPKALPTVKAPLQRAPLAGYGFVANVLQSCYLDDVPNDEWDVQVLSGDEVVDYAGLVCIDTAWCHCWWSLTHSAYIAQTAFGVRLT